MNAIARFIVRWYPAAWRERYEDEVLELLGSGRVRLADVCGLLRHCITERVLALYEPGRHISAYRFISGLTLLAYVSVLTVGTILVGAVPYFLGAVTRVTAGPFPERLTDAVGWILLSVFLVTVCWHLGQLFRSRTQQGKGSTMLVPMIDRAGWLLLLSYGALVFHRGLSTDLSFGNAFHHGLFVWLVAVQYLQPDNGMQWPGGNLFETLGRLRSARYDLRWARMELDRCEGLYAGRDPGPDLRAARAEMERLLAAEQTAVGELDAMGYHARFQS